MTDTALMLSLYVVAVVCLVAQWATARRGPDIKLFTGEPE